MRYYDNIEDLPLRNWRKITEHGDLRYTRVNIEEGTIKEDIKHDELIQDSYLAEFGLTQEFQRIIELKQDIAELQCDVVINDDRFLINRINSLKNELEEIQGRSVGVDMDEAITYIEMWRKIEVNEETMKTRKFFKLVRTYQKEIEKRKKSS